MKPGARPFLLVLSLVALGCASCRRFTKDRADTEVYGILQERRRVVPEVVGHLDVDVSHRLAQARRAKRVWTLTLVDALELAAAASRTYLQEREDVYLAALDLTSRRYDFGPIYGGRIGLGGRVGEDQISPEATLDASVSRNFENGSSVVMDLATGFLASLLTGDPFDVARSVLAADILIPLARGKGWVAREPLTQAERNVLYALRDYARFQQEFTVDIASSYYRMLEDRDNLRNAELAYESLTRLLERQAALGAKGAGRLPDFEVDQTRQNLLVAENRVIVSRTQLERSLDQFKLTLGIPVDTEMVLPEDDLLALRDRGPRPVPIDAGTAVSLALERRLDLRNVEDVEEDALRRTLIAKDALGFDIDLGLNALTRRNQGVRSAFRKLDSNAFAGLMIDLPLDRMAERNLFRTALIQAQRSHRSREELEDRITFQVREALRQLDRARQSSRIETEAVRLAERRVESTDLLLEAGQATTRDRLEAERALVTARNGLTRALVDHAIARLVLLRDVGVLEVGTGGRWVEPLARDGADGASPPAPVKRAGAAQPG